MFYYLRHYPLTWLVFAVVIFLSFMPVPETPLSDVAFIDKWTHVLMYLGQAGIIWFEYYRNHGLRFAPKPHGLRRSELSFAKLLVYAVLFPILLGGVIEVLQENCTNHMRSGDWLDFYADAVGVLLAWLLARLFLHLNK